MVYPIGKLIKRKYGQKQLMTLEEEVYTWPSRDITINQNASKTAILDPPPGWFNPREFKIPIMIGVRWITGLPTQVIMTKYAFDIQTGTIRITLYNMSVLPVTIPANSIKFYVDALVARLR